MEFVVLDTETTGLSPERGARLTEIAGIVIEDGKIRHDSSFSTLIDPECGIPYHITKITGITDEMVFGKPKFHEVLPEFLNFIGDRILVIQNAGFDLRFLDYFCNCCNLDIIRNYYIDTIHMSRKLFKGKHNLDAIMERLNITIPRNSRHRALGDVIATAEAFIKMSDMIGMDNMYPLLKRR